MAKFVIIGTYRVGSTLLKDVFGKHCLNEIFGHDYYINMNPKLSVVRGKRPLDYLEYHLNKPGLDIMGAKVMIDQLPGPALIKILKAPKYKKILLIRENLTDMAVSYVFMCVAKQTILFDKELYKEGLEKIPYAHGLMGTSRNMPKPFKVKIPELKKRCEDTFRRMHDCQKILEAQKAEYLKLTYNDLLLPSGELNLAVINTARKFVDLSEYDSYKSPLKKMANEEIYRKCIKNYDEINRVLGQRYGVLFSNKRPAIWEGE
jgi:hypothetical protein